MALLIHLTHPHLQLQNNDTHLSPLISLPLPLYAMVLQRCNYCTKKITGSLSKHASQCDAKIRLDSINFRKKRAARQPSYNKEKIICQKIDPAEISDRLLGDTHAAQQSTVSDQLIAAPTIRQLAEDNRRA